MPLASHLERRDAVYSWRRRPPAEIACQIGRSHLKISLRTMDSKNYGKSPQDKIRSIGEIREKAAALKSAQRGLAIGARNRHWTFIGQLIAFGRAQGLRIDRNLGRRRYPSDKLNIQDALVAESRRRLIRRRLLRLRATSGHRRFAGYRTRRPPIGL